MPVRGSPTPADVARAFVAAEALARSSPDTARPLEPILRALHDGLDGAFVAAFVLEHGRLWLVASRGCSIVPDGIPPGVGVVGRALATGAAQCVLNVSADPDYVEVAAGVRSELALPVHHHGKLVGLLNVQTPFTLRHGAAGAARGLVDALGPPLAALQQAGTLDIAGLARLFVYLGSLRDTAEVAALVAASLPRVLPLETAQLALWNGPDRLELVAGWHAESETPGLLDEDDVASLRSRVDGSALLAQLTADSSPELARRNVRSAVIVPLRVSGQELGVLIGTSRFGAPLEQGRSDLASLLAAHASVSLDATLTLRRERDAALTDPLTGILNRRGFEHALDRVLRDAEQGREPVTLLVLDLDDFKSLNDRAGHEVGDALLARLGAALRDLASAPAHAARIGGDEFAVMLPGSLPAGDLDVAGELLARLAAALEEDGLPARMSGGLAAYPFDAATATQLVRAADQALYDAKANGKNHLVAFGDLFRAEPGASPAARVMRSGTRGGGAALADAARAALTIWQGESAEAVLERLCASLTYVVGATAALASRVDGALLADVVRHTQHGTDLGPESSYVIEEFPLTARVLASGEACAISFLDDALDPAEAFVLRELGMNSCLLLPLVVGGGSWGLVELYEMRMRRYEDDDMSIAGCLTAMAARRLETLGDLRTRRRRLRAFRLPSRG